MTGYVIIVRILSIWCRYNNKLYFGGKRGVTAICACVVFLRGIYRAAVDVGATARQTVSCSRRDDQLIRTVNKAPARARASCPREPTFHRSPPPHVPCDPSARPDRFDRRGSPPSGSLSLGRRRGAFIGSRSLTVNPGRHKSFLSRPLTKTPLHAHVGYLFWK